VLAEPLTSEWPVLMGLIERTLGQSPEPH